MVGPASRIVADRRPTITIIKPSPSQIMARRRLYQLHVCDVVILCVCVSEIIVLFTSVTLMQSFERLSVAISANLSSAELT